MEWTTPGEIFHTPGAPFADLFAPPDSAEPFIPYGQLSDKYDICEILRGGMGEVMICRVARQNESKVYEDVAVALKTFQQKYFFQSDIRVAFNRETELWSRISGIPHIMPLVGFDTISDRPVVIMPAIARDHDGIRTVRDLLNRGRPDSGTAALLAAQVAVGMHLAVERLPGLVHGDLKPENLLLSNGTLFVSDFGLARVIGDHRPGDLQSTVAYQAPELRIGPSGSSTASDIYALGVILTELLTGTLPDPSGRQAASADGSGLFRNLLRLAARCTDATPEGRPTSFGDIYVTILGAADAEAPGLAEKIMEVTGHNNTAMKILAPVLFQVRIDFLLRLRRSHLILDEIEAKEACENSAFAQGARAEALSLLGRDEEAVGVFEKALELEPPERLRLRYLNGKALALQHLRRLDEATELFMQVIRESPAQDRPGLMMNLASVHMEEGGAVKALALLRKAAAMQPEMWEIWVNMGRAHEQLGGYSDAFGAYQHAVRLAPYEEAPLLSLATVCMDHLGLAAVAYTALEQLGGQGLISAEWATRWLACLLAAGAQSSAESFTGQVRAELSDQDAAAVVQKALELASRMSSEPNSPDESQATPEAPETRSPTFEDLVSSLPEGWEGNRSSGGTFPDAARTPRVAEAYAAARDGAPFLGIRAYLRQRFFCFDFFCAPTHPNYAAELIRHLVPSGSPSAARRPTSNAGTRQASRARPGPRRRGHSSRARNASGVAARAAATPPDRSQSACTCAHAQDCARSGSSLSARSTVRTGHSSGPRSVRATPSRSSTTARTSHG